jgi:NADH-quinone oxidoreductase subunit G
VRAAIVADAAHFATRDVPSAQPGADPAVWSAIGVEGPVDASMPLSSRIRDFYLTNPVARASVTMAECSRLYVGGAQMAAE